MAKKSRRARRQETTASAPEVSVSATPASGGVVQKTVDFASEYAYVYKELRTVLIIAVIMFVVLFGLSYILY